MRRIRSSDRLDPASTPFAFLGPRICIFGPSNSGKSTLSVLIGRQLNLPVIHLDRLRHEPGTFDRLRPIAEFHADHARAIQQAEWVIDGNYSSCLDERVERATGVILLDVSTGVSLFRYVKRCLRPEHRLGGVNPARDPVRLAMIRHILGPTRANRQRYRQIFDTIERPKLFLLSGKLS